jgi:hypothetical protein
MTNVTYRGPRNKLMTGSLLQRIVAGKSPVSFRGAVWIGMMLACATFWMCAAVIITRV